MRPKGQIRATRPSPAGGVERSRLPSGDRGARATRGDGERARSTSTFEEPQRCVSRVAIVKGSSSRARRRPSRDNAAAMQAAWRMALQSRGTGGVLVAAGGALMAWALLGAATGHPPRRSGTCRPAPPSPRRPRARSPSTAGPRGGPTHPRPRRRRPRPDGGAGGAADGGAGSAAPRFAEPFDVTTFQKGNIHTHTTRSDGDRPPQDVYRRYRDRGYAFLAITSTTTRLPTRRSSAC